MQSGVAEAPSINLHVQYIELRFLCFEGSLHFSSAMDFGLAGGINGYLQFFVSVSQLFFRAFVPKDLITAPVKTLQQKRYTSFR